MSEHDYQRGLRGGDCINFEAQAHSDWFAGKQDYEKAHSTIEYAVYSTPEDEERWWKEDKKKAYKEANDNIKSGLIMSPILFFTFLIGASILKWLLGFLNIYFLPSTAVWCFAILPVVIVFFQSRAHYKKDIEKAKQKYGKRD